LDAELKRLRSDPEQVAEYRLRLSDISWFMRLLCQPIARRANQESNVTGRFFAHRFNCQRLVDERALLACSMYIDLNLVRAGVAETPETSQFTSAFDRIRGRWQRSQREMGKSVDAVSPDEDQDAWLAPLFLDERAAAYPISAAPSSPLAQTTAGLGAPCPFPSPRASDKGFLPMTLDEYLSLLDWTGRQIRSDKRGAIPEHLAPIIERLQIAPDHWTDTVRHFGRLFRTAAGGLDAMRRQAASMGRQWLHGIRYCAAAFP
jgi:hypothetical protein